MNKRCIWDADDDPRGNLQHVAQHGLSKEDVEFVIESAEVVFASRRSGLTCVFGHTPSDIYIIVIFEDVDMEFIYPITSYEVPEPAR